MRVLMLSQFYPPVIGGEERHVLSLSEGLVQRGHQVAVATMPHPERAEVEVNGGVAIHSLRGLCQRASSLFSEVERPHAPPFTDPELLYRLNRLVAKFKPDIVHGHNWLLHSYLPSKLWSDIGIVSSLHDYSLCCSVKTLVRDGVNCDGPQVSKCLKCAGKHFGGAMGVVTSTTHFAFASLHRRLADAFIAVSGAVAEKCGIVGGDTPYHILPTFIPDNLGALSVEEDLRLRKLPPDGYLLFVGDLNRRKGVDVLIDAYARLRDAPPLVLIGRRCTDTPQRLPDNVFLFESWPHAAIMHAWNRCLFGLVPSTYVEPCGTVVMEANVVGKTVIACGHGGLAELVEDGRTGLLTPPGDASALAAAMQSLISDESLRASLAVNVRAKAESFMAKSIIPRIEAIYGDVRAARARRSLRIAIVRATAGRQHGL